MKNLTHDAEPQGGSHSNLNEEEKRLQEELERKKKDIQEDKQELLDDEKEAKQIEKEIDEIEKEREHQRHVIHFFIDKKPHKTEEKILTANFILEHFAKVDPKIKTLALKEGDAYHEYADGATEIHMRDGMIFTVFDNEKTTTS